MNKLNKIRNIEIENKNINETKQLDKNQISLEMGGIL